EKLPGFTFQNLRRPTQGIGDDEARCKASTSQNAAVELPGFRMHESFGAEPFARGQPHDHGSNNPGDRANFGSYVHAAFVFGGQHADGKPRDIGRRPNLKVDAVAIEDGDKGQPGPDKRYRGSADNHRNAAIVRQTAQAQGYRGKGQVESNLDAQ